MEVNLTPGHYFRKQVISRQDEVGVNKKTSTFPYVHPLPGLFRNVNKQIVNVDTAVEWSYIPSPIQNSLPIQTMCVYHRCYTSTDSPLSQFPHRRINPGFEWWHAGGDDSRCGFANPKLFTQQTGHVSTKYLVKHFAHACWYLGLTYQFSSITFTSAIKCVVSEYSTRWQSHSVRYHTKVISMHHCYRQSVV